MFNDFDRAAQNYDTNFTHSKIGKAQRKMVFKYLNSIINKDKKLSILELNCGTGEDAIHFAKLGHHVLATDISEGMINVAKAKSYLKNLMFKTQDINAINKNTFDKKFDLIFSNFGGFNCLDQKDIQAFFETTSSILAKNGRIILVMMPKNTLWEQIYFSLKGQFKKAKRRKTNNYVIANVDGVEVKTWYYNPKEIFTLTKSEYSEEKIKPIGLAIPPSYLEHSFLTKKPLLSILKWIDNTISGSFWAKYADHFYIELKKK